MKKKMHKKKKKKKKTCQGAFLGISTFRVVQCCIDYKHELNGKMSPN